MVALAQQRVRSLVTRFRRELGKDDLFEYTRGREGSTGPSRGEHRLTVYHAHTSFDQKNGHSSKSVNSFGAGPIFCHSLGQDLSRNAFVVSVYAFEKKFDRWKDFCMAPKN